MCSLTSLTHGFYERGIGSGLRALKLIALSVIFSMCLTQPSASAQSVAPPNPAKASTVLTEDGWTFSPAFSGSRVVGFLATHDPSTIPSHTYSIIWYQRQADDTFTWEGWSGRSPAAAARAIAFRSGTLDMFQQPELNVASQVASGQVALNDEAAIATLVPMVNGVTAWSIFAQVMPLLTPETAEAVVEMAAEGAVALTSQGVRETGGCGPNFNPTNGDPTTTTNSNGRSSSGAPGSIDSLTQRLRWRAFHAEIAAREFDNPGQIVEQPPAAWAIFGCCFGSATTSFCGPVVTSSNGTHPIATPAICEYAVTQLCRDFITTFNRDCSSTTKIVNRTVTFPPATSPVNANGSCP